MEIGGDGLTKSFQRKKTDGELCDEYEKWFKEINLNPRIRWTNGEKIRIRLIISSFGGRILVSLKLSDSR